MALRKDWLAAKAPSESGPKKKINYFHKDTFHTIFLLVHIVRAMAYSTKPLLKMHIHLYMSNVLDILTMV